MKTTLLSTASVVTVLYLGLMSVLSVFSAPDDLPKGEKVPPPNQIVEVGKLGTYTTTTHQAQYRDLSLEEIDMLPRRGKEPTVSVKIRLAGKPINSDIHPEIMLVGLDDEEKIMWAMTAGSALKAKEWNTVSGYSPQMQKGVLSRTPKVWIRIID
jgi:hypothetical protein